MPTLLPLLRRLCLLLLAVSLALPPLVAEAFPGPPVPDAVQAEDPYVPPCHGVGAAVSDAHSASESPADCNLLCLWLCAHANAVAANGLHLPASAAPAGPVLHRTSLPRGPVLPVLLRPPIV
jgi:hypothetical protein